MLLADRRPARVSVLVGGIPEVLEGIATIRPDGWVEIAGRFGAARDSEVAVRRCYPAERVQSVEWLEDGPLSPWSELAQPDFAPADVSVSSGFQSRRFAAAPLPARPIGSTSASTAFGAGRTASRIRMSSGSAFRPTRSSASPTRRSACCVVR